MQKSTKSRSKRDLKSLKTKTSEEELRESGAHLLAGQATTQVRNTSSAESPQMECAEWVSSIVFAMPLQAMCVQCIISTLRSLIAFTFSVCRGTPEWNL